MSTATTTDHEAAGRVPEAISMIVLAWRGLEELLDEL
jgi:hypothetical protein